MGKMIELQEGNMKKIIFKKRSKKIFIGVGISFFVIIFFVVRSLFFSEDTSDSQYTIYQITEIEPLKLEGKVDFIDTKDIFFDSSLGKIVEINVENGTEVTKDSPLLTYNNSESAATETEQENTVNRNTLQVQQAQETINLATQKYNEAVNKLTKAKNQLNTVNDEEKSSINTEIQQLADAVSIANNEVVQARQAYDLANNDMVAANNSLEETRSKINSVVKAPIDGQVSIDLDAINNSEKPVIRISTQKKNIKGKITEYDYDKLKVGQEATVTTNGSGKTASGKIVFISQTPLVKEESNTVTSYQIEVEGEFPWVEGLSTTISVPQKQMVIPESAVQKENDKEVVYIYKDGKAKKNVIETEMDSGRKVVKSGLTWKDKVILNPNKELKEDQEIQVVSND